MAKDDLQEAVHLKATVRLYLVGLCALSCCYLAVAGCIQPILQTRFLSAAPVSRIFQEAFQSRALVIVDERNCIFALFSFETQALEKLSKREFEAHQFDTLGLARLFLQCRVGPGGIYQ